jgi:predicted 2-oxoglutarate/Fe(II)-dependent dioxygenase YbiX
MPTPSFFAGLGLFVVKDFFDAELCARIRSEMRVAAGSQGRIYKRGTVLIDEKERKTKHMKVDAPTMSCVEERLRGLKPALESHFHLVLTGCETPQFLIYREGDFFRRHLDHCREPDDPQYLQDRRVSVVVFLNGQTEAPGPDSYCGGSLKLYGLIDDPLWKACGLPLIGEQGLLVAFRADVLHEVETITHGERCTIVNWFS